ncbi:unnamed protein product [Soboliphyme baturini]|uniref:CRAL-TRIO domain-containing protein n=1 Tax=Soboliphyme baturini TaxID=241478 RepID=A0A183IJB1_9BILA|nr:unnamed protein product [Soboliphyme baturini]
MCRRTISSYASLPRGATMFFQEDTTVIELRRRLGSLLTEKYGTHFNLLRWTKLEHGNVSETYLRLKQHLIIRRHFRLDHIVEEMPDNDLICKYYPLSYIGPCGKGNNHLLVMDELGRVDLRGLSQCVFLEQLYEKMNVIEHATGSQAGVVYVVDLDGLKLDLALIGMVNMFRTWWTVLGDNYVGWVEQCFLINTPWFFGKVWNIFLAALPQLTSMPICILGKDWHKELLKFVEADQLPKYWGGNMVDENGDERCSSKIQYPLSEKIPKKLYWKSQISGDYFNDYQILSVSAGAKTNLTFHVKEADVTIRWNMYANEDYGFVLRFSENAASDVNDILYPYLDYPGKVAPSDQSLYHSGTGFYYFCFVNNAWIQSANIKYQIEFVSKSGQPADVMKLT